MSDLPIKGLDETLAVLSAFPKNLQKNAIRQGMRAAGNIVRDEARLRAPKDTGKMAKAIRTGSPRRNRDGTFSVSVRLTGNDHAFLGLFHEYGVAPHYITAGDAQDISARTINRRRGEPSAVGDDALVINGQFVRGAVLHPGHGAHPFMRPALDIKADDAVRAMSDKIKEFVQTKVGFKAAA